MPPYLHPPTLLRILRILLLTLLLTHSIHTLAAPAPLIYHLPFLAPLTVLAACLGAGSFIYPPASWAVVVVLSIVVVGRLFLVVWVHAKGVCGGVWTADAELRRECAGVEWALAEVVVVWAVEGGVLGWRVTKAARELGGWRRGMWGVWGAWGRRGEREDGIALTARGGGRVE